MYKVDVSINEKLNETTYETTLKNGLKVYICKRPGFKKKIALFGTKYGSTTNNFVDISTNKRVSVPDGVAHFLEHKLFEKPGTNALEEAAKKGISVNAYTSFNQTVYYFETIDKFDDGLEFLVNLIKEPYFTDENVEKEKGIIGQEILMGQDDPSYNVYFNALKAMYKNNTVRIDIAGTIDSISKINKEVLYTCYHTFYNPKNMFFVVVGDVEVDETIVKIEEEIKKYEKGYGKESKNTKIETYREDEPEEINTKLIEDVKEVYMSQLCIGYKLNSVQKDDIVKNQVVSEMVSDMYFSKISDFYEKEYLKGTLNEPLEFECLCTENYSYVVICGASTRVDELKEDITHYINNIRLEDIDDEMFEIVKKKKIGLMELLSDNISMSYSRIIDSILNSNEIYKDVEVLENITKEDVKDFLQLLLPECQVTSIIKNKTNID